MLKKSPIPQAEEFAIHDYEGFEGADIQEYTSIETVVKLTAFIDEHGELGGKFLSNFHDDLEGAEAAYEHHAGEYKSLAEFAQEIIEQSTEIPESLGNYIDYAAIARDMEFNGDVFTMSLVLSASMFSGRTKSNPTPKINQPQGVRTMQLQYIPLDQLTISPLNIRHSRKALDVSDIISSIQERGIQQRSLVSSTAIIDKTIMPVLLMDQR